jgi:rhodanese-related sulfurtransferase
MDEIQSPGGTGKRLQLILIITVVIVSCIALVAAAFLFEVFEQEPAGPFITTTYSSVTPENASILAANNESVIIIDVRSCKCNYNKEHLPNAIWNTDWTTFYNETKDILVYDSTDFGSMNFCEQLINKIYGEIYYLQGGINAWKEAGYDTIT